MGMDLCALCSRFLVGLGWSPKFAFLTNSQVVPELLVQEPHLENHCYGIFPMYLMYHLY